ncbi:tRNA(Ile)-lysidine synthase [Sphingomonas gellani]|uniref:tRNA(Ile)-lysidine synthase n=1 Tax=Sphingomonas gellani TaxID=1166340 RepID=A0A1H8IWQ5_9SPHN|nr:tRNA lysidine(34) synthetase TilS [Sphingomonas gellani]SEN72575.1 tRNA(Ile)-lysidine synthase [Sphingomonas gellani]
MPPQSASDPGAAAADEQIERFRRDLTAALGRSLAPGDRIACAVSGGPDSMAMLWLATQAFPGQVLAASVDHGLRADAAAEVAMVARWCAGAGVPHAALAIATPAPASGNIHAWARRERYRLMVAFAHGAGAAALCTAHHADDQVETFLMRAARGAGLSGLAAIRPRLLAGVGGEAQGVPILRPLLAWRRAALRSVCRTAELPFIDDPSNADPRFERARFRAWLADAPWLDATAVARAASQLEEVDADLTSMTRWLWRERASEAALGRVRIDVADLPREMRRRLARLAVAHVADIDESGAGLNVERLLDALEAGEQAMLADVLARAEGANWHFSRAPARRS